MKHRTGIAVALLYYTTDTTQPYQSMVMNVVGGQNDLFTAQIPAQVAGTEIFYYVQALANSGKQQVRPMPAPTGYWHFHILAPAGINENSAAKLEVLSVFPNPTKGIITIPVNFLQATYVTITLEDVTGKVVAKIFDGNTNQGLRQFIFDTKNSAKGIYALRVQTNNGQVVKKLVVQ